jgi:hypothetical protein
MIRQHRLMAGVGQIDDRKATMAQSHAAAVEPDTLFVRSAVLERRCHRIDRSKMTGIRCVCKEMPAIPHIASGPCPCRRRFAPFHGDQT